LLHISGLRPSCFFRYDERKADGVLPLEASGSFRTSYDDQDVDRALAFVVTGPIPDHFDSTFHALQVFENVGFPNLARHLGVLNWFRTGVSPIDDSDGRIIGPVSHPINLVIEKIEELVAFVDAFDRRLRSLIGQPMNSDDIGRLDYFRYHVPHRSGLMDTIDEIIARARSEFVDLEIGGGTLQLTRPPGLDTVVVDDSEKIIQAVTDKVDVDGDATVDWKMQEE
jgi:hypothetical protein